MVDGGKTEQADGLYGRLLQRLALALEEARSNAQLHDREPLELDLHGVSEAELELIRAYQEGDLQWLRGWQAAAKELAFIQRQDQRPSRAERMGRVDAGRLPLLHCALCGEALVGPFSLAGPICRGCGSRLFRSGKSR
jgi:hypothetical protein